MTSHSDVRVQVNVYLNHPNDQWMFFCFAGNLRIDTHASYNGRKWHIQYHHCCPRSADPIFLFRRWNHTVHTSDQKVCWWPYGTQSYRDSDTYSFANFWILWVLKPKMTCYHQITLPLGSDLPYWLIFPTKHYKYMQGNCTSSFDRVIQIM